MLSTALFSDYRAFSRVSVVIVVVPSVVAIPPPFMVVIPAIVVAALVTGPTIAVIAAMIVMPGAYHTPRQQRQGKTEHAQT